MTFAELERAVKKPLPQELSRFRAWVDEYYAQKWDEQIETDVKSGKLDQSMAEALEAHNAGLSAPL